MAEDEERIIRNKIDEIVNHDQEVKNNPELMDIFRVAYGRRDAGKPMQVVALALDKSLAGYITSHGPGETPDSVLDLHKEMQKLSGIQININYVDYLFIMIRVNADLFCIKLANETKMQV